MKLKNPFTPESREWFRDCWHCWDCGENGQRTGGLELHHITGRDSNATINGAILCKGCHIKALHTQSEEAGYTLTTLKYLQPLGYEITQKDINHLTKHPWLVTRELTEWIQRLPIVKKLFT
jgi:hypothetical protein